MAIAIGLLRTLLEVAATKKSGVVDVAVAGSRVRIFLENGVIVYADEGTVEETLGRILVREHVISADQYWAALERMTELLSSQKSVRLGDVMVELGILRPEQVHAALFAQVQQKVVRALGWAASTPSFAEAHGGLAFEGRFAVALEPLVVAALRAADPEKLASIFTQSTARYPVLRVDDGASRSETYARITALDLRAIESAFARSIDGTRSVSELLEERSGFQPAVVLAALLLLDCLDLRDASHAPRRSAPPRPTRRPRDGLRSPRVVDPSRRPPVPSASVSLSPRRRREAQAATHRLKDARDAKRSLRTSAVASAVSKSGGARVDPSSPIARIIAESSFQLGKDLVRANQMREAETALARAAELHPAAEYALWAAWAALRNDPSDARAAAAREAAERALAQDQRAAFAAFVLGHLALREGQATKAHAFFERARRFEPGVIDDLRDLQIKASGRPRRFRQLPSRAPRAGEASPELASAAPQGGAEGADDGSATALAAPHLAVLRDAAEELRLEPYSVSEVAASDVEAFPFLDPPEAPIRFSRPPAPSLPPESPRRAAAAPPARRVPVFAIGALVLVASALVWALAGPRPGGESMRGPAASASVPASIAPRPAFASASPSALPEPAADASASALVDAAATNVATDDASSADDAAAADDAAITVGEAGSAESGTGALVVEPSLAVADASGAVAPSPSSTSSPTASAASAASPSSPTASAVVASARSAASSAAPSVATGASPAEALPDFVGAIDLPPLADGHRVYVDGKMVAVAPAPVRVACGRRTIRVGSAGRDREIDVPCRGHVAVSYP